MPDPWIIATACLTRGLTPDETDLVANELTTLEPQIAPTPGEAHALLTIAIAIVLEQTRGVILDEQLDTSIKPSRASPTASF